MSILLLFAGDGRGVVASWLGSYYAGCLFGSGVVRTTSRRIYQVLMV